MAAGGDTPRKVTSAQEVLPLVSPPPPPPPLIRTEADATSPNARSCSISSSLRRFVSSPPSAPTTLALGSPPTHTVRCPSAAPPPRRPAV
eukprot:COSAG01_NODE_6188_length_3802_cov_12.619330_1_plen_89_part_10